MNKLLYIVNYYSLLLIGVLSRKSFADIFWSCYFLTIRKFEEKKTPNTNRDVFLSIQFHIFAPKDIFKKKIKNNHKVQKKM